MVRENVYKPLKLERAIGYSLVLSKQVLSNYSGSHLD
jgi:hypothetical protein